MTTTEQVTCSKCGKTYIPSFTFDFYPDRDDPKVGQCENCLMRETFADSSPQPSPVSIPAEYENTFCMMGKGAKTCSFLMMGAGGFKCAKGSNFESTIKKRIQEGSLNAQGDNCTGPPDFTPTDE